MDYEEFEKICGKEARKYLNDSSRENFKIHIFTRDYENNICRMIACENIKKYDETLYFDFIEKENIIEMKIYFSDFCVEITKESEEK